MGIPESRLYCRLDGLTTAAREQQRMLVLNELSLLETESIPIFEEATQTAAHFLEMPICILSLVDQQRQWFKSTVGLSRLGLMNELAISRQMPRDESFCIHVVDSHQMLAIEDTLSHPAFASGLLAQHYNIRAYLGAPLLTSGGECVGTLAVMDQSPKRFTVKEMEFLALTARLSMSEYERLHFAKTQWALHDRSSAVKPSSSSQRNSTDSYPVNLVKVELLAQLTQELRTPLTSVMGMASVLNREIYGPLTTKQKEYLDIIHHSGQYLLSLVKEILELSQLDNSTKTLNLTSVDIEMLCQQAIDTLEQAANRREQKIRLSVEPGNRLWLLDKEKIRQMLYHLIFSVIQASNASSVIRLHVSHKSKGLKLTVWATHPCLGDGLAYAEMYASQISAVSAADHTESHTSAFSLNGSPHTALLDELNAAIDLDTEGLQKNLGLLLSQQLAEMHGGQVSIQGAAESGYRYAITLPRLTEMKNRNLGSSALS